MPEFELTCLWIETCDRPSAGMAAHVVQGVIPVCSYHADLFQIPLIKPRKVS